MKHLTKSNACALARILSAVPIGCAVAYVVFELWIHLPH
jgi:hypothetical protein